MPPKDSSLYGLPRPKKTATAKPISTSTLAFTSTLSSLISSRSISDAPKPTKKSTGKKDDIFSTHNRGALKRAAADIAPTPNGQTHSTDSPDLDPHTLRRTRRKLEEKARLYAALKRGDVDDAEGKYAVDFDRKWAEENPEDKEAVSSEGEDDDDSDGDEMVEYVDEFGRTRKGTRAQAAREARLIRAREEGRAEPDIFSSRPAPPSQLIYGDVIQTAAFNPEARIAEAMAELAAKRDRPDTPPPETHFDGRGEMREKGVGFFQFSAEEGERERQMEELAAERRETEKRQEEAKRRVEERRKLVEERRKLVEERRRAIGEKRGKLKADKFLDSLAGEMGGTEKPESGGKEGDVDKGK
ncbi:hypothetical protein EJ06DRAFT_497201, partial [Trichodelitschia bisporula]